MNIQELSDDQLDAHIEDIQDLIKTSEYLTRLYLEYRRDIGIAPFPEDHDHEIFNALYNSDEEFTAEWDADSDITNQRATLKNELTEANNELLKRKIRYLEEKESEYEEMMAMFAHKFRGPLDSIIYNTAHENKPKLYIESAQTMRGLLDIFSVISTDPDSLNARLKQDMQGKGNLLSLLRKTLDMILLHLLSAPATEKIQQHYMSYAKAHGLCDPELSRKSWNEECYELEQQLQLQWEQGYANLIDQSDELSARLTWIEQHFFRLELRGFDTDSIQFREYGYKESLLMILLNEVLVNAFKFYASAEKLPVILEWGDRNGYQLLTCQNPSTRNERSISKGSRKGHTFLSALARKTGSRLVKPKMKDVFIFEYELPNEILIANKEK